MPDIVLEQAIYSGLSPDCLQLMARSPGFVDDWLPEAERLGAAFGVRPPGIACPQALFAQPFGRRQVAIVQVADHADGHNPSALRFHLLILSREAYQRLGGDPFLIADQFPPPWDVRGELPVLSLPATGFPRRTVAQLEEILKGQDDSPVLLGGAQALVDGGRLVFERQAPAAQLVRGLWMLLPTTTRFDLWPATFAFSNALGFDALVVADARSDEYQGFLSEQQAGDYPQGSYELNLQIAVEARDQQGLDALLSRRSRRETWRMGLLLLALVFVLVLVSKWLTLPSPPAAERKSRPAAERLDPKPSATPRTRDQTP
ncbi:MAG TPA: hypothetical protein VG099_09220 [Gemmataceae bacterium]|nr:hypothetical protein [Gemmataceae bacterium]